MSVLRRFKLQSSPIEELKRQPKIVYSAGRGAKLGQAGMHNKHLVMIGLVVQPRNFTSSASLFLLNWYQRCSIRAPMAGRKVEVLELGIGQLKLDCVEKISDFKKQIFNHS
ncbi:hypothetical protein IEQ34_016573 [Dendrobium chrysotoxum]|uniref:Uncharacterized protein n=1 Tax=Dendrobium chrysotoxum TaxID=161865 RepID=A0AAV7FYF8_DENCH|nr:hypothetical protein IEQ34_016573 [Dendrobium chrysotoxum]